MFWLLGLLGSKGITLALVISLLGSAAGGAYAMRRWDNATKYKEQVSALQHQLAKERKIAEDTRKAYEADTQTAQENAANMERLQGIINDITSKIGSPNSVCFSDAESLQLRRLWRIR